MWGWLIAAAVVARVIYVTAVKSERPASSGSASAPPVAGKSGCVGIVVTLVGLPLLVYGVIGLYIGESGVFVIALLLLGLGWLLLKRH